MTDDITKILENNKKVKDLIILENEIDEINKKINTIDIDLKKDEYDRLMCELSIKNMNLMYSKQKLDEESKKIFENVKIFFEYNRLVEKIKLIEKKSKKSNDLVLTENSEGRKKEIDSKLVEYYNKCVDNKKNLSKDFSKAIAFLNSYNLQNNKENEVKIENKKEENKNEENKNEIVNDYVGLASLRYNNPVIEENKNEEKNKNHLKLPFMTKVKKYAVGFTIGLAAVISVLSFGATKNNKNIKTKANIEQEENTEENMNEISVEKQIDDILNEEEKTTDNNDTIISSEKEKVITNLEVEEIKEKTLKDNLNVSPSSKIMTNQYDATNYENGKHPYYDSSEQRTIEGIVYKLPDGTIKTARTEADISYYSNIEGALVTAYLTYSKYGVEGFYSINDVVDNKSKKLTKKL